VTLIAVNYHYVRPSGNFPAVGIAGTTPERMRAQLELLGWQGTFVSGQEVAAALEGRGRLPERALIVTFDDGLREQYDHGWPVLRDMGIPALFFINTGPVAGGAVSTVHKIHQLRARLDDARFLELIREQDVGFDMGMNGVAEAAARHYRYDELPVARMKYYLNFVLTAERRDALIGRCFNAAFGGDEPAISRALYMGPEEIGSLGRAGCIGSHAHEHVPLGSLADELVTGQIRISLDRLEEWAGYRPYALSYPYGSLEACADGVAHIAAGLGIRMAFTMERAANREPMRPMKLGRFDNNDLPGGKAPRFSAGDLFDAAPTAIWS
jgi:peptidoglycan/xylan/chitin deacetylase (PgdA/CDA1 family)